MPIYYFSQHLLMSTSGNGFDFEQVEYIRRQRRRRPKTLNSNARENPEAPKTPKTSFLHACLVAERSIH